MNTENIGINVTENTKIAKLDIPEDITVEESEEVARSKSVHPAGPPMTYWLDDKGILRCFLVGKEISNGITLSVNPLPFEW